MPLKTRAELHRTPTRVLASMAEEAGGDGSLRKDLLVDFVEGNYQVVWWNAMRKARTLRKAEDLDDEELEEAVEEELGLEQGTASAGDLSKYFELKKDEGTNPEARVPEELTKAEILGELAKFPEHSGSSPSLIEEDSGAWDTEGLMRYLNRLGGPSSSRPETEDVGPPREGPEGIFGKVRALERLLGREEAEPTTIEEAEAMVRDLEEALREENDRGEDDWWGAMRRLRTKGIFSGRRNVQIQAFVEDELGLEDGTATIADLASYGREDRVASVPTPLNRVELLTELGKHRTYKGLGEVEIEDRVPCLGVFPTLTELRNHLDLLGGPSASSPTSKGPTLREAVSYLSGTPRFRGMTGRQIRGAIPGFFSQEGLGDLVRMWRVWERYPGTPLPTTWMEDPTEAMKELRGAPGFGGLSDSEVIEKAEGMVGKKFVTTDDLWRLAGGKPISEVPLDAPSSFPPPDRDNKEWWDAMRDLMSLRAVPTTKDDSERVALVAKICRLYPEEVRSEDLRYICDVARDQGIRDSSTTQRRLTRSETMTEIAKFPRYGGMGAAEIEGKVPRAGRIASSKELLKHLEHLGGPSSSSPKVATGFWDSMRRLRTLEELQSKTDDEIVAMAGEGSLEDLFKRMRKGSSTSFSKVPKPLSRGQILTELSKTPRYGGMSPDEISKAVPGSAADLMRHLNNLGGPSSSDP